MSLPNSQIDLKPVPGLAGKIIAVGASVVNIQTAGHAYDPAVVSYVLVEFGTNGQALRWRCDGVNPTASDGILQGQYNQRFMTVQMYNNLRVIRQSGSDSAMIVLPLSM